MRSGGGGSVGTEVRVSAWVCVNAVWVAKWVSGDECRTSKEPRRGRVAQDGGQRQSGVKV